MTTLIRHSFGGHKIRLCNAHCYNAKGTTCSCICGGINHGAGYEKVLQKSNEVVQALLNHKGIEGIQVKLPVVQETMPIEIY